MVAFGRYASLLRGRALDLLDEVVEAVRRWPEFDEQADVDEHLIVAIGKAHRLFKPR